MRSRTAPTASLLVDLFTVQAYGDLHAVAPIVAIAAISAVFSLICHLVHYEALRALSVLLPAVGLQARRKVLLVVSGAVLAHVFEIVLFGIAFWLSLKFDLPALTDISFKEAFYLSIESYSSLGTSGGFPVGPIRILAGLESLVGLILIGWTTSYTYLTMREFWNNH